MPNFIKVIAVKIDDSFYFEDYLYLLNAISVQKILSYHFRIDQVRSFTSELLKHYYLADILNIAPKDLIIKNSELGKPFLASHQNIDFSISHSGESVVMAIADRPVGIDIEKIDLNIDVTGMSKMVFSVSENNLINNNIQNFFLLWTKKEALFKAHGTGFINDYYNKTNLNIDLVEEKNEYTIYSQRFTENYYLSLCVLPR